MPRQVHLFDRPSRFVAGTVGQPGDRTFFLQAIDGARVVSVSLEKTQVAVLADRMEELLGEVEARGAIPATPASAEPRPRPDPGLDIVSLLAGPTPAPTGGAAEDTEPLSSPVEEEFRVGAMGLAWDSDQSTVVIEAVAASDEPVSEEEILSDGEEGPDALRVRITPTVARSFIVRARRVIAAGRPPCPLCALPLDPAGHVCPRQNGYRR